jgi:hypothetical protein
MFTARDARTALATFIVLVCSLFVRSARADPATLSGTWTATAMTSNWVIGDWGTACGPKPSGGGAPAGVATITQQGNELSISGAGKTYTTTTCWEEFPGLTRTSHSASARNWRNTCKTPAGDPRQASIITTISATDNQISFDETGQYQFVIKGQNCTASVRRTRFFKLTQRLGEPPVTAPAAPSSLPEPLTKPVETPEKKPAPKIDCSTKGPPERLEVRPSRKLMLPAQTFAFSALVVDAKGCNLGLSPSWALVGDPEGVKLLGPGRVEVLPTSPEGEVRLTAAVGSRSVSVIVEVVSRERYEALLASGGFDPSGASAEAAVTRIETGSIGSRGTVVEDDRGKHRTLFVAVVGSAAVILGVVGVLLMRRNRKAPPPSSRRAPLSQPSAAPVRRAQPMTCPTCREEFPSGAQFCPNDGNRLVPLERGLGAGPAGGVCPICGQGYDPGVTTCPKHNEPLVPPGVQASPRAEAPPKIQKICPMCGAQFSGESQFCGQCGAALVPMN